MAKITQSAFLGEIRNKVGDLVFSRNRYGPFTRGYVIPTQVSTSARVVCQTRWAAAVLSWNDDLTDTDRYGWNGLAHTLGSRPGPVNGRKLSGRTLFLSSYTNLDNIGVAPLVQTPDAPIAGQLHSLTAACNADTVDLIIDASEGDNPPDQGLIIFASPPLNASRYTARDLWRQIASVTPNPSFPTNIWEEYTAIWPAPTPGQVIILGVSAVAALTGLAGPRLVARTIVTGTGDAMLHAQATLTDAQIKALQTTPITLLAVAATKILVLHTAYVRVHATAGAYTNVDALPNGILYLQAADILSITLDASSLLTTAEHKSATATPLAQVISASDLIYQPGQDGVGPTGADLQITAANPSGDYTGGNAANTMTVDIYYSLLNA